MFFHHLHKKIFSLLLILALTIPANAAVSVSDGSAFVSKAEFSTDITNLSNRMAQLENSLDAKIDSLVSSYLSRNGIWNGEKQEIGMTSIPENKNRCLGALSSNVYIYKSFASRSGSGATAYFPFAASRTSNSSQYCYKNSSLSYNLGTWVKSGLSMMTVSHRFADWNIGWNATRPYAASISKTDTFTIKTGGDDFVLTWIWNRAMGFTDYDGMDYIAQQPLNTSVVYFFVQKGANFSISFQEVYSGNACFTPLTSATDSHFAFIYSGSANGSGSLSWSAPIIY